MGVESRFFVFVCLFVVVNPPSGIFKFADIPDIKPLQNLDTTLSLKRSALWKQNKPCPNHITNGTAKWWYVSDDISCFLFLISQYKLNRVLVSFHFILRLYHWMINKKQQMAELYWVWRRISKIATSCMTKKEKFKIFVMSFQTLKHVCMDERIKQISI